MRGWNTMLTFEVIAAVVVSACASAPQPSVAVQPTGAAAPTAAPAVTDAGVAVSDKKPDRRVVFQIGSPAARRSIGQAGELAARDENAASHRLTSTFDAEPLVIDATDGYTVMNPIPAPRRFDTIATFVEFARANLGAEKVSTNGSVSTITGRAVVLGTPMRVDPTSHHLYRIQDPVLYYLTGLTGELQIGPRSYALGRSVEVCVDCQDGGAVPSPGGPGGLHVAPDGDPCSGNNCVSGSSFNNNILGIYINVGGSTTQVSGGFQTSTSFCWLDGFIPWLCTTSSGSNTLAVTTTFFGKAPSGAPNPFPLLTLPTLRQNNVTQVTQSEWGIFVGSGSGILGSIDGTCAAHSGLGVGWAVATFTTANGLVGNNGQGCPL